MTGASATWIDPTGTEWPLTDRSLGWCTLNAVAELGAAPVSIATIADPRGGSVPQHIQPVSRYITWPLHVWGDDHGQFLTRWRNLVRAFTRTRREGPGLLVVTRPDDSAREIEAFYSAGLPGTPGMGLLNDDAAITLYCPDPYWADRVPATVLREYGVWGSYLDPYPSVSGSQVLGDTVLPNPGEVEAWPTWVITGPTSLITATNVSTGDSWVLDPNAAGIAHGPLLAGETVTVTTRPPTVRGPAGEIWTAALNWPGATLWPLEPGDNAVTFTLAGAGAGSQVELTYKPRYETS